MVTMLKKQILPEVHLMIKKGKKVLRSLRIDSLIPNPMQPRILFDERALEELAESIRENGIEQPISVEGPLLYMATPTFIIHDGERRWRAAKRAGLKRIPCVVSPALNGTGPRQRLELALMANVQREEMHPIEEGRAYKRLIEEFKYSPTGVAKKVGKHLTRIYYCLKLLELDMPIQELMLARKLPAQDIGVNALLEIPNSAERIAMAKALAEKNATAKMIVNACHRYLGLKKAIKWNKKGSPAKELIGGKELPEWDALYQVGKVPPWKFFTESIMKTCDECPLRSIASQITCRDCALVTMTNTLLEKCHAK